MKYYIEKQGDLITTKGITVDDSVLNDGQIDVTKEEFDSIQQYIPPIEEIVVEPTIEERVQAVEEVILGLL